MAKYIQIPEPVKIESIRTKDGDAIEYSFRDYLMEYVWPDPRWRVDAKTAAAMTECQEAFAAVMLMSTTPPSLKIGAWVEVGAEAFDVLKPIATREGERLNPNVAVELSQLIKAVLCASVVKPKELEVSN